MKMNDKRPPCFGLLYSEKPSSETESCKLCNFVIECSQIKIKKCYGKNINRLPECSYCTMKMKCLDEYNRTKFVSSKAHEVVSAPPSHYIPKKVESDYSELIEILKKGECDMETIFNSFMKRYSPKKVKEINKMLYAISLITPIKKDDSNNMSI